MPERDDSSSPLGQLNRRLYQPQSVDGIASTPIQGAVPGKPEGWKADPLAPEKRPARFSGSAIFLMFAGGFFVLAGIAAAVVLFLGGRSVSSDHLAIAIEGPTSLAGGESVPLLITVTNKNPLPVQNAILELDFPEGSFVSEDATEPLQHVVEELGNIAPGASVRTTVRAAFFAEENKRISIPLTVTYTTENSNATFVARDTYGFVIATAPVSVSVETLEEVPAGQPLTLVVTVRSNAPGTLENVAVRADYPFGFVPAETEPVPEGGVFPVGSLAPGEEKEIVITGPLSGTEGDERVFTFSVGSLVAGTNQFSTAYGTRTAVVEITKPFLAVGLSVNRDTKETVVIRTGDVQTAVLSWQNALQSPVLDGRLSVAFAGDALNPSSVKATGGFYRSSDRTVLFSPQTSSGLASLPPGGGGSGTMTFETRKGASMDALRNPTITMTVSVSGRRAGEGSVAETVTSTLTRTLLIASDLTVSPRTLRTTGPFSNTGPWPPAAEQKSTYTIAMTAKNTVNSVASGAVRTTLPPYVRYTGQANPVGAIAYDEATREVLWTVGELAAGATKDAAFQVELLPSVSQKGTSPALTGRFLVTGFDRFAKVELEAEANALTTQAPSDPAYTAGKSDVQ